MKYLIHAALVLGAIMFFDSSMGPWAMTALFFGAFAIIVVVAGFIRSHPGETHADSRVIYEGASGRSLFTVDALTPERSFKTSRSDNIALGNNTPVLEGEFIPRVTAR